MKARLFGLMQRVLALLPVRHFKRLPGVARVYTRIYRTLKPHGIKEIACVGQRMVVHLHDEGIARQLLIKGIYEEEETHFFQQWLKPGMAVLDVGANFGYFTLLAAQAVGPSGMVLAFEPEPANFALLEQNIALNGHAHVRAFALALSDREGSVALFKDPANLGNPSFSEHNVPASGDEVEVPTTRLDALLAREAGMPARFDFLKMDVQGAKALVLAGAKALLARDRPWLLIEVWPKGLRNMGADPKALLEELESLGYTATRVSRDPARATALRPSDILRICERREDGEDFMNVLFRAAAAPDSSPSRRA